MITERPIHVDVKDMLINNEPFSYAHLVKFERPSRPDANGLTSTSKERYAYLTDASREVVYDDGSKNLAGVANGAQNYLANKLIKVSPVSEQTEAKASNYSITLDGNGIGAYATGSVTATAVSATQWDLAWPASVDLIGAGFREGDKITLATTFAGDYNIDSFRANNTIRVTKIDTNITPGTGTVVMTLSSEEIKSILLDKNSGSYSSFINREVFIYRAYFQEGAIVGTPILIFKGIISNVGFDDNDNGIQVTWGMTSHWGDFAQVRGRVTSDDFHRALDENGIPQPLSALKVPYAYDKGFSHSETSINILATYTVQVEKQTIKAKKGFFGIGAKVKVKKYLVNEDRNSELDFQLQAKSIPIIYGVRNTSGIPLFADTLNNNSSVVYVVYGLSEGEIGGIYDLYIDGNSLICNDKADFDARSVQTPDNTVQLVCRGRADRGDVLGGATSSAGIPANYYTGNEYLYTEFNYNMVMLSNYRPYVVPVTASTDVTGKGIIDGESIQLTSPQQITLDFFSGKQGQKASSHLVEIAKNNNFKIQNSYWTGTDTAEYWGPNHRLLDTAYAVGKFIIAEGETSIPTPEFIVRGKVIDCYNYDYSYSHDPKTTGESAANFLLGDTVTLYNTSNVAISTPLQIIDKWTFANPDGTLNTRFRFSGTPNLGYVNGEPTVKKFYMQNGASQRWTMITYNYEEFSGTVAAAISVAPTSVSNVGGLLAINYPSTPAITAGHALTNNAPAISVMTSGLGVYEGSNLFNTHRMIMGNSVSATQFVSQIPYTAPVAALATTAIGGGNRIASRNTVTLSAGASAVDDFYNGYIITVYRYNAATDKQVSQVRVINDYIGSTKQVVIDDVWDAELVPAVGDTIIITPPYPDKRVSINPAMQTMDYITSKTYGRGLHYSKDLELSSWLESGRICDTQSNVTVQYSNAVTPTAGQIYRFPSAGTLLWQGQVVAAAGGFVEFEKVLGKLTNGWNSWRTFALNELVHTSNRLYQVTSAGIKATEPTHTTGTVNGLLYIGAGISLTSTNGGPALTMAFDGNPIRALKDGNIVSGYSLYDCDEVNYWRYLGWDEFSQRYVTRHQTNLTIDTSLPLFENTNSLLEHFGGILRYSAGKYHLAVEEPEGIISTADSEPRNITADHIIGKIRLTDEGTRSAFNSLTAAFPDPANKFEARNISFFNSNYLKIDRNVPKKGNVSVPGITNYYNTRILADKFLNKSRFGLTISFNMAPRGLLLLAGTVIQLQYPRYGWVNKKFRISAITHQEDCTVDIVAEEYDDSFYTISKLSRQAGTGGGGTGVVTTISAPTGLITSSVDTGDETYSGVEISWTNSPDSNTRNVYTELYSSVSSKLYLTVNTIAANTLTSTVPHELQINELVTSNVTMNGLIEGKTYFVKSIPSSTQFTLSETKGGATTALTSGGSLGAIIQTGNLIATLPTPTNSFVDVFGGIDGRIVKYYWVRHKILQI